MLDRQRQFLYLYDENEALEVPILEVMLREAIKRHWPDDVVMADFADIVAPHIIRIMSNMPAKGGEFALQKKAEGKNVSRYERDQSMRAHILNGLLVSLRLLRLAQEAGNEFALELGDYERRLLIATYVLHDYTKMLDQELHEEFANPSPDTMPDILAIIDQWAQNFELQTFLWQGGHDWNINDVAFAIHNTQIRWGTAPLALFKDSVSDIGMVRSVANFSRIADLLAYGTFFEDDNLQRINEILSKTLFQRPFSLTHHRVSEVTGILTAYIHNGVVRLMEDYGHTPILFAPDGIIYASPRSAVFPSIDEIEAKIADEIQLAALEGIERSARNVAPVGIAWGTQGLKIAPFINDLFSTKDVIKLIWRYVSWRMLDTKPRKLNTLKVYKRLVKGIELEYFEADALEVVQSHIDVRAEAIGDFLAFLATLNDHEANVSITVMLETLTGQQNLDPIWEVVNNAQKGGVHYWTALIAANFVADNSSLSPEDVDTLFTAKLLPAIASALDDDAMESQLMFNVRRYIRESVNLSGMAVAGIERFVEEIAQYQQTKEVRTVFYDTLYNIPFGAEPQDEATMPYKPTIYSQRVPLGKGDSLGSGWRRGISAIGTVNLLLMQLGMQFPYNFEDRRAKMLFVYPTYYFTPETGDIVLDVMYQMRSLNLYDWLTYAQRGTPEVFDAEMVMQFGQFLKEPKNRPNTQTMYYPAHIAPTITQVAIDTNADTVTESWLVPIMAALLLATVLDVKVVVTESPVPIYPTGTAFKETVVIDAPSTMIESLIDTHITIDNVVQRLQWFTIALAVTYERYDFKWKFFADVGRRLADDGANVFKYYGSLDDKRRSSAATRYIQYAQILPQGRSNTLNHARELVTRYRQFYRAEYPLRPNGTLRPLSDAAAVILKADAAHSDPELLLEAIVGKLIANESAMFAHSLKGRFPKGYNPRDGQAAMRDFAEYFVYGYYVNALKQRKSLLRGPQFNLLSNACDAVYRDIEEAERQAALEAQQSDQQEDNE